MFDVIGLPVAVPSLRTARLASRYIGLCRSDGVVCEPVSWPST